MAGSRRLFFEDDATRALLFAKRSADNPAKQYTAKAIAAPAVVGAVLSVNHWLDMTTQTGLSEFADAYEGFKAALPDTVAELHNRPTDEADQDVLLRSLDAAVFRFIHETREEQQDTPFQAVRAAFRQGQEIAPGSGFHNNTHVQIAVREPACILGWFLVPGDELLSTDAYNDARNKLDKAQKTWKPRRAAGSDRAT